MLSSKRGIAGGNLSDLQEVSLLIFLLNHFNNKEL